MMMEWVIISILRLRYWHEACLNKQVVQFGRHPEIIEDIYLENGTAESGADTDGKDEDGRHQTDDKIRLQTLCLNQNIATR